MESKATRTHLLSGAADPDSILAGFVRHGFQEVGVVLCETQVVIGAHVDDVLNRLPS